MFWSGRIWKGIFEGFKINREVVCLVSLWLIFVILGLLPHYVKEWWWGFLIQMWDVGCRFGKKNYFSFLRINRGGGDGVCMFWEEASFCADYEGWCRRLKFFVFMILKEEILMKNIDMGILRALPTTKEMKKIWRWEKPMQRRAWRGHGWRLKCLRSRWSGFLKASHLKQLLMGMMVSDVRVFGLSYKLLSL